MSLKQQQLCSLLIQEHFGNDVQKVHDELQWGPRTLRLIILNTGLPIGAIKSSLSTLIQYGFASFKAGKTVVVEYNLLPQKILLLLRYPKYLSLINDRYDELSRYLIEAFLKNGNLTATQAIFLAWSKLKIGGSSKFNNKVIVLKKALLELISGQFLMRCPRPENDLERVPFLTVKEEELFSPPQLNVASLIELEKKGETSNPEDTVRWRCNFDKFHQDLRDDLLINAVKCKFDDHGARIMEVLLRLTYLRTDGWASQGNPVPVTELRDTLERDKKDTHAVQYLDQYLRLFEDDESNFLGRHSEGSTASVYIKFISAFKSLAVSTVESVIDHKLGTKATRIFRMIYHKVYLDQERIQKLGMIPDKMSKKLTSRLVTESFIQLVELKKSSTGPGPLKNFYLFNVQLNQVVQVVLDMCFKTISNTLIRAAHEKNENIRLIEKIEKISIDAQRLRDQGTDEAVVNEFIHTFVSPPEKSLLDTVEGVIQKLRFAELHVDETIFLLQLFIYYESCKFQGKK